MSATELLNYQTKLLMILSLTPYFIYLIKRKVKLLKCVRYKLPENILRSLYFPVVNPYYEYGTIVCAVKYCLFAKIISHTEKGNRDNITNSAWRAHT